MGQQKKCALKLNFNKIIILILLSFLMACNAIKRVPNGKFLLKENVITVDNSSKNTTDLQELLIQKPNSDILGYNFRLNIYNIAKPNPDSTYRAKFVNNPDLLKRQISIFSEKQVKRKGESYLNKGFHEFLKKTGETPVLVDKQKIQNTVERFKIYFQNNGYFRTNISYKIDCVGIKRQKVSYLINKGAVSLIDSIENK